MKTTTYNNLKTVIVDILNTHDMVVDAYDLICAFTNDEVLTLAQNEQIETTIVSKTVNDLYLTECLDGDYTPKQYQEMVALLGKWLPLLKEKDKKVLKKVEKIEQKAPTPTPKKQREMIFNKKGQISPKNIAPKNIAPKEVKLSKNAKANIEEREKAKALKKRQLEEKIAFFLANGCDPLKMPPKKQTTKTKAVVKQLAKKPAKKLILGYTNIKSKSLDLSALREKARGLF